MENLIGQGIELAVFGMGTVFLFLALLILATALMSSVVLRFFPDSASLPPATVMQAKTINAAVEDKRLVAIISTAITQHRTNT